MLQKTYSRKAAGPDSMPARDLNDLAADVAHILALIFNTPLQECTVLEDWRRANVTAIYK